MPAPAASQLSGTRSKSFKRRQARKASSERKNAAKQAFEASNLTKALCNAALAAKAAYEAAYEAAELRGGSELDVRPPGGELSAGELALNAITQIDSFVDNLLGRGCMATAAAADDSGCTSSAPVDSACAEPRSAYGTGHAGPVSHLQGQPTAPPSAAIGGDDDLPDWLKSAAIDLGTSIDRPAPAGEPRKTTRRTRKTND